MELRLHVHRVHRVHFRAGLFRHLDRVGLHPRSGRGVDLALQVHSERRQRTRGSLPFFPCFQDHRCPGSQTGRYPLGRLSSHLCGRSTGGRWRGPPSHARLVRSDWHSHRVRSRGSLLLCGWYSSLHLDGCSPILRDDRRFNHPLLRGRFGSGGLFWPPQFAQGHRPRHGQHVSGGLDLRCDLVDWGFLPGWFGRGRSTASGFPCHDPQRRQGPQASGHLVLCVANPLHRPDVHHRIGMPSHLPRP